MSTFASYILHRNIVVKLYKHYIFDSIRIVRRNGFKELLRRRGWKIFIVIGGYYLVRDTIVYVVIPYCIAGGLF